MCGLGVHCGHTAVCFESKNGCLKHIFHSRGDILGQLAFNVDVQQTLQLLPPLLQNETQRCILLPPLLQNETQRCIEFLGEMSGAAMPRRHMHQVGQRIYVVGNCDPSSAVDYNRLGAVPEATFTRACIHITLYQTKAYVKGQGKRHNHVCYYESEEEVRFGMIEYIVLVPHPVALV